MMKRLKYISCIIIILLLSYTSYGQTDRFFWFAVPQVTNGSNAYFNISTLSLPATVTISIDDGSFSPLVINMEAETSERIDMSAYVANMENQPANTILGKGVLIQSTQLITAYYEINNTDNRDIFVLKGANALGTLFFAPFQNIYDNSGSLYSAIDIVAIQDGTTVWITPKADVIGHAVGGGTYNITLDEGETYSCRAANPDALLHLGGTAIVSDNPIAITVTDDAVNVSGDIDLIGDQLVPVSVIGQEYIVSRGDTLYESFYNSEYVYIVATEPNTDIHIDGAVLPTTTIGTGVTYRHELLKTPKSTHIWASEPVYVFHVYAFENEVGGAILPSIDGCNGSYEVSLTRPTTLAFYLNLYVENGFAKNSFWLEYEDESIVNIDESRFENVGTSGWVVLKDGDFANNTSGGIPSGQVTRIFNTKGRFHAEVTSGSKSNGCKNGYLTDYSVERGIGEIASVHLDSVLHCYGDSLQLIAFGGTDYFWDSYPSEQPWIAYLTDRNISDPKAFLGPDTIYDYRVDITRPCLGDTTMRVVVNVANQVEALFSVDNSEGCAEFVVNVVDASVNAELNSYRWIFEPGDTIPNTTTPGAHTYNNVTDTIIDYYLKLVVRNDDNCPDTLIRTITVSPIITADFEPLDSTSCNPMSVSFINQSTGGNMTGVAYEWDFGDGNSSLETSPLHDFLNAGGSNDTIFTTSLVAKSIFNCTDTLEMDYTIHRYIKAEFELDTVAGCSPFTIDVEATTYPGINSYTWDYGDGVGSDTGDDPVPYEYNNTTGITDTVELQLLVTNVDGCRDSLIRQIHIYSSVEAGYAVDSLNFCDRTNVAFTDTSKVTIDSYNWDFGDGGSSNEQHPVHFYEYPGIDTDTLYTAQLIAATIFGCADTFSQDIMVYPFIESEFTVNEAIGCAPFEVVINNQSLAGGIDSYNWDYGDGSGPYSTFVYEDTVRHTYQNALPTEQSYDLELVVMDDSGNCTDTLIRSILVYPKVTASFDVDTSAGCHPLEVTFTNASTVAPPATYDWDFGDGVYSTDLDPVHVFSKFGITDTIYTVVLEVSSNYSCSHDTFLNINVYHNALAKFNIDQTFDCSPLVISPRDTSDGADNFIWDFGDGSATVADVPIPTHSYPNPTATDTSFNLQLFATTTFGCNDTTNLILTVYPVVTADFSFSDSICSPSEIDFTNNSINTDTYFWDFGNGVNSGAEEPSILFINTSDADTTFMVSLTATSSYNCVDDTVQPVVIYPSPLVEFFVDPVYQTYYDDETTVALMNQTQPDGFPWTYEWDYGDGGILTTFSTATINHPYLSWADAADDFKYTISLTVSSGNCEASVSHAVIVVPPLPEVEIINPPLGGCAPFDVDFTVISNYGDTYFWDFDDGTTSNEMEPYHVFENDGIYNVMLRVEGEGGINEDYIYVVVDKTPIPEFIYTPSNIYYIGEDTLLCEQRSSYGYTYFWDFGDESGEHEGERVTHVYRMELDINEELEMHILLRAEAEHGCWDTISHVLTISIRGTVELPNAFTPGAENGRYLTFMPDPKITTGVKEFHMYIYNRWGELLFVTDDVNLGWDGMYKGKLVEQDVYIWKVEVQFSNGAAREFAGDVTLLR